MGLPAHRSFLNIPDAAAIIPGTASYAHGPIREDKVSSRKKGTSWNAISERSFSSSYAPSWSFRSRASRPRNRRPPLPTRRRRTSTRWLMLGPFPSPLPAFIAGEKQKFGAAKLLSYEEIPLSSMKPVEDAAQALLFGAKAVMAERRGRHERRIDPRRRRAAGDRLPRRLCRGPALDRRSP